MSLPEGRRVLIVAQAAPARGGIPSFVTNLMSDPGFRPEVDFSLFNTTRSAQRRAGGLTVRNILNSLVDAFELARRARGVDVVHVQTAMLPIGPLVRAVALCAAARSAGAGVVAHVHSGRFNSGRAEAVSLQGSERFLLRRLGAVCDRIVAVSRVGAENLSSLVEPAQVTFLHNAVDVGTFTAADKAPSTPGAPCRVVYVGTLSRRKGLPELVAALETLSAEGLLVELEVVGGAHEVGDVEAQGVLSSCEGVRFPVRQRGSLDAEQVREALREADVFALPSHWEGQPIAILEAMASGLPVVATTVGANPDVVRDGVDGRLVEPGDVEGLAQALRELVQDRELREIAGRQARARVHEIADLPVLRRGLLAIYLAVVRENRVRRDGRRRAPVPAVVVTAPEEV